MPHFPAENSIPRQPKRPNKPDIPYREPEEDQQYRQGSQQLISRLSLFKHDVEPEKVFKQLYGKEAEIDEHSGELVQPKSGPPSTGQ